MVENPCKSLVNPWKIPRNPCLQGKAELPLRGRRVLPIRRQAPCLLLRHQCGDGGHGRPWRLALRPRWQRLLALGAPRGRLRRRQAAARLRSGLGLSQLGRVLGALPFATASSLGRSQGCAGTWPTRAKRAHGHAFQRLPAPPGRAPGSSPRLRVSTLSRPGPGGGRRGLGPSQAALRPLNELHLQGALGDAPLATQVHPALGERGLATSTQLLKAFSKPFRHEME